MDNIGHCCHFVIFQRKMTLLKEHEDQFKSNKFVDKRIGEHDTSLSLEDKMMKRYAKERAVKNNYLLF